MEPVNIVAVLVGAVASYIVGALWYSLLFKKPWMREMGHSSESMKGGGMTPKMYIIGFVGEFVTVYVLAHVVQAFGGSPFEGAFWVWLGFQATLLVNSVLYENRSWTLYAINASHRLAALMAAAAILSLFA